MGYIGINRKLFEHTMWKEDRVFSKAEAWIDLIQLASFKNKNTVLIKGSYVNYDRGQIPVSYSYLMKRWRWTQFTTRLFFKNLKIQQMIDTKTTGKTTILTICNYDVYNPEPQGDQQANHKITTSRPQDDHNNIRRKEGEEGEEEKEDFFKFLKKQEKEAEKDTTEFIRALMNDEI